MRWGAQGRIRFIFLLSFLRSTSGFLFNNRRRSVHLLFVEGRRMQEKNAKTCDKGSEDGWNSVRESKAKRNRQPRNLQSSSSDWGKVPLQIEHIPPDETTTRFVPYMLLLAGLPGSGKTTFARSLLESMPYKVCILELSHLLCLQ